MANLIKIKRGLKNNLPTLEFGELGFTTDTNELFIGSPNAEVQNPDVKIRLDEPDVLPPAFTVNSTAFSPNSTYLSVGHFDSPFITIYKRNGDTFTKLADPSDLPASNAFGTSFSPDGTYLSVAHDDSPFITIYKRSGDTFTKLDNPAALPSSTGNGTAFSPNGDYLSVAHDDSPFITIYKRDGDTFTKLADPSVLPPNRGNGTAFSPDSTYLSVAHNDSPFVTIYKRDGDTFTKLADPDVLPPTITLGTDFSPDGNYLSFGGFANFVGFDEATGTFIFSSTIIIYKRNGDTFTKLANPDVLPTGIANETAFSPDSTYLSVAHTFGFGDFGGGPDARGITIYKRNGDTFTKLADPDVLPTSDGRGTAFSHDGNYLSFVGSANSVFDEEINEFVIAGPPIDIYKNEINIGPGNVLLNKN